MGGHRPKGQLDRVRAYPELGEGTPSAPRAVAAECKHYAYCMEQALTASIKRGIDSSLQPSERDDPSLGSETYWTVQPTSLGILALALRQSIGRHRPRCAAGTGGQTLKPAPPESMSHA